MRILIVFTAVSSLTLALVATSIVMLTRREPIPVYQPLSSRLLPGSPIPETSMCDWYYYSYGDETGYCRTYQSPGSSVSFSYDRKTNRIVRSVIEIPDKAIGNLILAWGTPLGYISDGFGVKIEWEGRSAYTIGQHFDPGSRAWFVEYFSNEQRYHPWRGFGELVLLHKQD